MIHVQERSLSQPKTHQSSSMKSPLVFAVMAAATLSANAVVFFDDFSSTTITDQPQGHLGGWFPADQFSFGQWYGDTNESGTTLEIANSNLTVSTDSTFRSTVMLLDPATFTDGAGSYLVTVSVTGGQFDTGSGRVLVWGGSGYDLSLSSGNGIEVRPKAGDLIAKGGTSVEDLGDLSINSVGTHSLQFDYDGTSAVAIFLGLSRTGWPEPEISYGSITLTYIPEPSAALLSALSLAGLLARRRR